MKNDFSNELKALETQWEPVSEVLAYPLLENINANYLKRTKSLLARWENETGAIFDETQAALVDFGIWLRDIQRDRLSPSAWRSYRYQCTQALPYQVFTSIVSVPPSNKKKDVVKNTSHGRRKHLKEDAFIKLKAHFSSSKSPYAQDIVELVGATILTGLRPSEWQHARVELHEGYMKYLKVKNVKKGTQQLSVPKTYRAIPLSHLDADQLALIENTLARFKEVADPGLYQKHLMNVFGRATQICFAGEKSRPSLYSARHQFAANLKSSGISKKAIAAVMGHVSENIQTHHYGRTVNGSSTLLNEDEAIQINEVMT